jgi:hypothetical protein
MDLWLSAEIRIRREDALENARRTRLARVASSGRSPRLFMADRAQAMSELLAALARSLRNGEPA